MESALLQASFLVIVVERVIAAGITPVFEKFAWDKFWLTYIAWVLGGALVFLCKVNFFSVVVPEVDPLVGQILSAVVAGGGANLLHDLFPSKTALVVSQVEQTAESLKPLQ